MEMFNPDVLKERIGPLKKSENLTDLQEVEKYVIPKLIESGLESSYDVLAQEMPYFKTMGYTEYATCFIFQPLNMEIRSKMMRDAFEDNVEIHDFAKYFRNNILNKQANKYQERETDDRYPLKSVLVVLPGSNKIKERTCLNKLKYIAKTYKGDVWFKPHPITTHAVIGELKDILGEDQLLPRNVDMYHYLKFATKVFTTHISESAMYGVSMGKKIEPIDVLNGIQMGSFYNINRFLFENQEDGENWINKTLSSPKSGFICPKLDTDWRKKVDDYIEYILWVREKYKNWFIDQNPKKKN